MRFSEFFLHTLKESPAEAEIISHKLMLRAGLIRRLASGLYTWLPLGLRVLRKVESIVRAEMDKSGAIEILMPSIQPAELWQESQRWEHYGPLLLKIQDRNKREFCYGPTHEEVVTDLVRRELKSYKQVPVTLYQIQTKFRDEIRPRFGLMRAREFLMKDAYSFHLNTDSLKKTYDTLYETYSRIFTRLGLKFRAVLADTGNIGGSVSHEFHVLAETGEDLLAYSDSSDYAANVELASALLPQGERAKPIQPMTKTKTPGIKTVEGQAEHLGILVNQILKTLIVKGKTTEHPFVALLVRGDHQLNPLKAEKHPLVASPFEMAKVEEVQALAKCGPGFVGPIGLNIPIIADHSVLLMDNFLCGANEEDTHHINVNWERDHALPEAFDLREVQAGDKSPDGKGTLHFTRGIEVGHIFQLGDKYSKAMDATVLDETGKARPLIMGCYGIGVSRIVAAAIEQNHDENGICWPPEMAPFQVVIIPINMSKSLLVKDTAISLYQTFTKAGIEVLLDDRDERAGVMFADADLIGIPNRVVVSEKTLASGSLEYKFRQDKTSKLISKDEILAVLKANIA